MQSMGKTLETLRHTMLMELKYPQLDLTDHMDLMGLMEVMEIQEERKFIIV